MLEGLRQVREGGAGPAESQPAAAATSVAPSASPDQEAPADTPADEGQPDAGAEAPADAGAPPPAPPAEPAEPPGMAQVRKQEQHLRRQIAAERAQMLQEFEAQKATWQAQIAKANELQAKLDSARQDPIAFLQAAGFDAERDFDALGRLVYAHSPEGAKNPASKAAAHQTLAQREQAAKIDNMARELKELREYQQQTIAQQQVQQKLDAYAENVVRGIGDTSPIAKSAYAKNPTKVRQALLATADRLYAESGPSDDLRDIPTPAEVIAAYEAERRAELEMYGIDIGSIGKPRPAAPPAAPPARPAATIAPSGGAAPTVPSGGPQTQEELRAKALEGLAKIRSTGSPA